MSIIIDLVGSIVSSVAPLLVDPIVRQCKYLFLLSNNVNAMIDAMDSLRAKRESIKQDIHNAELEGNACSPEVELWLQKVDFIELEVAAIQQAFDDRLTKCVAMPAASSLNVVSNYKIGRRAFKQTEKVVQQQLKAEKFEVVAKRLPPGPARELMTPLIVLDMDPKLKIIYRYLEDNTVGMVGILGMGGVGKTTLLRTINNEFYRHEKKDSMFDHVIWVVISQQYNYKKIRSDIAKNLGLLSTHADVDAVAIHDFLKKKSFLLLLDDLWSTLDLEKIGVPQPHIGYNDQEKHRRRMVVFTTRLETVCSGMDAKKTMKLECLSHDDAWCLFKEKAGEELIASDKQIQHYAEDIVKRCGGLPLALVTVGKAMRTKNTAQQWQYVANMMRKSKYPSIPGIKKESNFFPILKISYDNLESDTLRQCFLYCSLWAEDKLISHDSLIECWMGHGLLNDFDEAYNKGDFFIGILKEACLLESGNKEFSSMSFVKLHDVIRDLALWIASDCGENKRGWLVKPNANLERLPQDITDDREVINLSGNKITALDGFPNNCHKLKTLILSENLGLSLISMEFFTKMRRLKYLDLGLTVITTLPEEIGMLIELEYLNLSSSLLLECLPMALGDLKNLKYLYCARCSEMKNIPCGLIARLTKLQILDLYKSGFYFSEEGTYVDELLSLSSQLKAVGINIQGLSTLKRVSPVPKKRLLLMDKDEDNIYNGNSNLTTSISISPSLLGSNRKTSLHQFSICKIPSLQELVMTTESDHSSWCLSHLRFLYLL